MKKLIFLLFIFLVTFPGLLLAATSDTFPPYVAAPSYTTYLSGGVCTRSFYISTTGNNSNNGSIGSPWADLRGATTNSATGGDCIFYRAGTYAPAGGNTSWIEALSELHRNGSAGNYIVITAYTGETPTFTSSHGSWSFSVRGNYVIVDGLTFGTGGNVLFYGGNNIVFQNNTFNTGSGEDGWGDQVTGVQLGFSDVSTVTIRNNYFGDSTQHSIKTFLSGANHDNYTIQYNRFYNNSAGYGCIGQKGNADSWDVSYNKFEDVLEAFRFGQHYSDPISNGLSVHHNVFDNASEIFYLEDFIFYNLNFYSNIVLNGSTIVHYLYCGENGTTLGTVYDNALYGISDLISCRNSNYQNYPSYWDYNAVTSTTIRDSAENQNSVSGWNSHALVQVTSAITRTGVVGNRLYTIDSANGFKNAGRYGDTIGGFTFTGGGDTTPPTVTAFAIPATSTPVVPITTFTAIDAVGVTGYCLNESATAPTAATCAGSGWAATAQTSYTFTTIGSKTLYAWAKDVAGNISTSLNDSVIITMPTVGGVTGVGISIR